MEITSLVVDFDDLRRRQDVLTDGTAEIGKNMSISLYFRLFSTFFVLFTCLCLLNHFNIHYL